MTLKFTTLGTILVPYSGLFSWGANFRSLPTSHEIFSTPCDRRYSVKVTNEGTPPPIGPARMCRVPSRIKYGDHAIESLSDDAL